MRLVGKPLLFCLGILSLVFGGIGAFLPILPTTPFIILAAYFFNKSSPRMHSWVLALPTVGPMVKEWDESGVISLRAKKLATVSIIIAFSISLTVAPVTIYLKALISCIGIAVLVFIWSRPSFPPSNS